MGEFVAQPTEPLQDEQEYHELSDAGETHEIKQGYALAVLPAPGYQVHVANRTYAASRRIRISQDHDQKVLLVELLPQERKKKG